MPWSAAHIEALRRLDPSVPADAEVYVDRPGEVVGRGWDLPGRLEPLLLTGHRVRALMHGAVGVGKSTEFLRWERELAGKVTVTRVELSGAPASWFDIARLLMTTHHATHAGTPPPVHSAPDRAALEAETARWFEHASAGPAPAVYLIDGLDLLDADAAAKLFGPSSLLCDDRLPSVVYTAPQAMITMSPSESRDSRFVQAWHLPPFPVVNQDGSWNEAVARHLARGLARRLAGLDLLEDVDSLLVRVALRSAGIPRHAVTILRSAVLATDGVAKVGARHVVLGERELRQDLEQSVAPDDYHALEATARGARLFLGPPRLVVKSAVVPYEGPANRYWVTHPLLWGLFGKDSL